MTVEEAICKIVELGWRVEFHHDPTTRSLEVLGDDQNPDRRARMHLAYRAFKEHPLEQLLQQMVWEIERHHRLFAGECRPERTRDGTR